MIMAEINFHIVHKWFLIAFLVGAGADLRADYLKDFKDALKSRETAESKYKSAESSYTAAQSIYRDSKKDLNIKEHRYLLRRSPFGLDVLPMHTDNSQVISSIANYGFTSRLRIMQGLWFFQVVGDYGVTFRGKSVSGSIASVAAEATIPVGPVIFRLQKSVYGVGTAEDDLENEYTYSRDYLGLNISLLGLLPFGGLQINKVNVSDFEAKYQDSNSDIAASSEASFSDGSYFEFAIVMSAYIHAID